jgi:hypothetical protein
LERRLRELVTIIDDHFGRTAARAARSRRDRRGGGVHGGFVNLLFECARRAGVRDGERWALQGALQLRLLRLIVSLPGGVERQGRRRSHGRRRTDVDRVSAAQNDAAGDQRGNGDGQTAAVAVVSARDLDRILAAAVRDLSPRALAAVTDVMVVVVVVDGMCSGSHEATSFDERWCKAQAARLHAAK